MDNKASKNREYSVFLYRNFKFCIFFYNKSKSKKSLNRFQRVTTPFLQKGAVSCYDNFLLEHFPHCGREKTETFFA